MRKFKFAGVSKVGNRFALRASNREEYPDLLVRNKNTNVKIVKLSKPMTKDEIREHLARRQDFKSPQILAVLRRDVSTPRRKTAKAKTTKKTVAKSSAKKSPEATQAVAA
jgi:hypothetical protein